MEDQSRIEEILGEWLDRRDAGERVDPEEVIAAHPELSEELRRRFKALSLMVDALGDLIVTGPTGTNVMDVQVVLWR